MCVRVAGWGAYYYIGCYTDNADNPDLGGSKTVLSTPTVSACTQQCQASGFPFAGIQRGNTCFCDMAYGTYGMEDGKTGRVKTTDLTLTLTIGLMTLNIHRFCI